MADPMNDDFDAAVAAAHLGARKAARLERSLTLLGGLSSVALVIGLGVWGYRIAVRDVSGVPVVRALEGPLRVASENPGGEIAAHQGLAVNSVAALGETMPLPEELALAPRPEELAEEDAVGMGLAAAPAAEAGDMRSALAATEAQGAQRLVALAGTIARDQGAQPAGPLAVQPPAVDAALPEDAEGAASSELTETLAAEAVDPAAAAEAPAIDAPPAINLALAEALGVAPETAAAAEAEGATVVMGGVGRSLRPPPRPASPQASRPAATGQIEAVETVSAPATAPRAEVDPASLTPGERLVQLGAFDDAESARAEWAVLTGRFGDLMAGKAMVVQSAQSGGRAFFRLRAQGFDGEDDARRFCAVLLAEQAACIPVAHR